MIPVFGIIFVIFEPRLSLAQSCLELFPSIPSKAALSQADQRRAVVDRLINGRGVEGSGPASTRKKVDPSQMNPQEISEAAMMRKMAPDVFSESFNFKSSQDWAALAASERFLEHSDQILAILFSTTPIPNSMNAFGGNFVIAKVPFREKLRDAFYARISEVAPLMISPEGRAINRDRFPLDHWLRNVVENIELVILQNLKVSVFESDLESTIQMLEFLVPYSLENSKPIPPFFTATIFNGLVNKRAYLQKLMVHNPTNQELQEIGYRLSQQFLNLINAISLKRPVSIGHGTQVTLVADFVATQLTQVPNYKILVTLLATKTRLNPEIENFIYQVLMENRNPTNLRDVHFAIFEVSYMMYHSKFEKESNPPARPPYSGGIGSNGV